MQRGCEKGMLIKVIEPMVYLIIIVNLVIAISYKRKSKKTPVKVVAPIVILEKKEVIIQKNDRHVEQVNLFVRICPGIWRITELFLFLFGAGRCNGNFGSSGKPDDLKYSIYSYGYYTVKMENPL
jgi:hypothetical protein